MRRTLLLTTLLIPLTACGEVGNLTDKLNPQRRLPTIAPVATQHLQPGGEVSVALSVTPPPNGTPITGMDLVNPAPDLITATLTGTTLALKVHPSALPQGLIPITVQVHVGEEAARLRIPIEIGDLITREYGRFNAIREQANLPAVTFDNEASMNCWMNGRYSVVNGRLEHNQDSSLPYASPEGQACATRSNLSMSSAAPGAIASVTPTTTRLFTAPFHALGMLQPTQTSVGIGTYSQLDSSGRYARMGSGITSLREGSTAGAAPMTFPGNGATTDLGRYNGGEWPDPLTACPEFQPGSTGLPLIVSTFSAVETTATEASLTVDGQAVPVCAYGSTQYVNTKDAPGNYVGGYRSAQDIGRSLLKSSGAVFVIPKQPLEPGRTYRASVKVNGQAMAWNFKTASTLTAQSLGVVGEVQLR
ncbi:CAP domain-containing protein [Deinococcus sp. SDU3-2]|uniref:CAP domain-containing protein n=1 Tax=Deinococcus terrestris TaxID=2651870 RepID=A0A7X1NXN8_9DEIO|nr:hypothetical protein [Deinococcus terrestris]MPY67712.1 CAP domain-containing protein [Deinococcus terrestris]